MAVPFNIPEEQSDVEVMLVQLHTLLNKLSVAIRQNQAANNAPQTPSSSQRVRTSSVGRRSRDSASSSSDAASSILSNSPALPDLLSNLSLLASVSETISSSPLTAIAANRSPRRRTSSESSCDETKISIMAKIKHGYQQDWNKVDGAQSPEILTSDGCDSSVLSKIMPCSISSCSLMTAMICFVGWHIFRAR